MLETVINATGHEVIFYPKFHCELNYIEYYWGAVKRYTRANCQYSFPELEKILFVALDSVATEDNPTVRSSEQKVDDGLYKRPDCGTA